MLAPVAAQRVLVGVASNITVQFIDQNGEPTSPLGAVTVDVTLADGTVVATGAATTSDGGTPPTYTYVLAAQASMNLLTFVWRDTGVVRLTTQADVVGGVYFTVAAARAFDAAITTTLATDAKVQATRREVEDECERITGCAWVPRYRRKHYPMQAGPSQMQWGWSTKLVLDDWAPRVIRSVRVYQDGTNYTLFTAANLTAITLNEWGMAERSDFAAWLSSLGGTTIEYEYGYDAPPPDLKHACLTRLRSRLYMEKTGIPDRAISYVPDSGGNFAIATPGRAGFETGIPEVDAVYARHKVKLPGVV